MFSWGKVKMFSKQLKIFKKNNFFLNLNFFFFTRLIRGWYAVDTRLIRGLRGWYAVDTRVYAVYFSNRVKVTRDRVEIRRFSLLAQGPVGTWWRRHIFVSRHKSIEVYMGSIWDHSELTSCILLHVYYFISILLRGSLFSASV